MMVEKVRSGLRIYRAVEWNSELQLHQLAICMPSFRISMGDLYVQELGLVTRHLQHWCRICRLYNSRLQLSSWALESAFVNEAVTRHLGGSRGPWKCGVSHIGSFLCFYVLTFVTVARYSAVSGGNFPLVRRPIAPEITRNRAGAPSPIIVVFYGLPRCCTFSRNRL